MSDTNDSVPVNDSLPIDATNVRCASCGTALDSAVEWQAHRNGDGHCAAATDHPAEPATIPSEDAPSA